MALLEVDNISVSFGGLKALDRVSLHVELGCIYGLIGPNGAGKSTLFNCLSRIYNPDEGRILFDGVNLLKYAPHQIIQLGIARTFQNTELFKSMNVMEHLIVGQHRIFKGNLISSSFGFGKKKEADVRKRAEKIIDLLDLKEIKDANVKDLPLGHQKLVELGRALCSMPKLLLLDEPAAGMNSTETNRLGGLVRRIRQEMGLTIMLVEHDMSFVMEICERILVLDFGQTIAEGLPEEIQKDNKVIEAYLGEGVEIAFT